MFFQGANRSSTSTRYEMMYTIFLLINVNLVFDEACYKKKTVIEVQEIEFGGFILESLEAVIKIRNEKAYIYRGSRRIVWLVTATVWLEDDLTWRLYLQYPRMITAPAPRPKITIARE